MELSEEEVTELDIEHEMSMDGENFQISLISLQHLNLNDLIGLDITQAQIPRLLYDCLPHEMMEGQKYFPILCTEIRAI